MATSYSLPKLLNEVGPRLTARRWRLFACACVRRMESATRGNSGAAIELAERYADGKATAHQLASARFTGRFAPGHAAWAVCWDPQKDPREMADRALAWVTGHLAGSAHQFHYRREEEAQTHLLLELTHHLLEPVSLDSIWLAWSDRTIPNLAQSIYNDRAWDQMPILADALEDAGCSNPRLLDHCRSSNNHIRGCWLLDLLLAQS